MPVWVQILQALLTPTIAIVVAYIAWQQWQLAQRRLKLDLYDRRRRVYEEMRKFFGIVISKGDLDVAELTGFWSNVSEADFLFGTEVTDFLDELFGHAADLSRWNAEYRALTEGKPSTHTSSELAEWTLNEQMWLHEQTDRARKLFRPYMKLHG